LRKNSHQHIANNKNRQFAIEQARRRREINAIIEAELQERFDIPERIKRLSRIDENLS
jgi:hypothetical protein